MNEKLVCYKPLIKERIEEVDPFRFRATKIYAVQKLAVVKIQNRECAALTQIQNVWNGGRVNADSLGVDMRGGFGIGAQPAQELCPDVWFWGVFGRLLEIGGTGRVF